MHCDFISLDRFTSFNIKKIKLKSYLNDTGLSTQISDERSQRLQDAVTLAGLYCPCCLVATGSSSWSCETAFLGVAFLI